MRRSIALFAALTACAAPRPAPPSAAPPAPLPSPAARAAAAKPAYPPTPREPLVETKFGVAVSDPYRWLEDASAAPVQQWLAAEDALTRRTLEALPGRAKLREQLRALSYLERVSPPKKRGSCLFYERRDAGKEQRTLYLGGLGAPEPPATAGTRASAPRAAVQGCPSTRAVLDGASLSAHGTASFKAWEPSPDGRWLAYVVHPNNADAGELRLRDVQTGEDSAIDVIGGAKYAVPQWTPDGRGFYYVALPTDPGIAAAALPGHSEVKLHRLGTAPARDQVVFPKTGRPDTELDAQLSHDGRWLFVSVIRGGSVSALHLRDLAAKGAPFRPLVQDHDGTMSAVAHGGAIYLRTTDGAPRGRVLRIDPRRPARAHWKELVPEHADKVLDDVGVVGGKLALQYQSEGSSELQLRALDAAAAADDALQLPGIGRATSLVGTPDDDVAYFGYGSFDAPGSVHQVSARDRKVSLWYATPTPIDTSAIAVERVRYPSKDGTPISMFVAVRRDAPRDGSVPFLLSGYGGFNISVAPTFQPLYLVWLAAGGGVALPGLRGGGERGEAWHRAGMLDKKQNVFDDFIAAAEFLIGERRTRPDKLAILGRSNGGLLVGAALTQRPELFGAVLCGVPVLDMLRFARFGDGQTWTPEFGSPDDEAGFRTLLSYSPYHRVRPGTPYPSVLFLSASADDRVAPLHAWKMTAALQAASSSTRPILLRVEPRAGHGGADQVAARVEESADALAFALAQLGGAAPR